MAVHPLKKGKTVRQQVSREEWDKRVDLAAAYRLMDLYGMTEMSANHIIDARSGEDNAFLINPYGLMYDQMARRASSSSTSRARCSSTRPSTASTRPAT